MIHALIIAEAGFNHRGDLNLAIKWVDSVLQAGVNLVKFQSFKRTKFVPVFIKPDDQPIKAANFD